MYSKGVSSKNCIDSGKSLLKGGRNKDNKGSSSFRTGSRLLEVAATLNMLR